MEEGCIEEEQDVSTQLSQTQKNQRIDLQDHLKRFCNVLPVFDFNSVKYDINLIKSYLLPLLVDERGFEPTVMKKANQFVSSNCGHNQLLDILNFLGEATSLDSSLKAYKTSDDRLFFHWNGSVTQESSTILNLLLTKPSLANCATKISFKKTVLRFSKFNRWRLDI